MPSSLAPLRRTFAAIGVVGLVLACGTVKDATQFTVGVTTQIVVPDDVQSVRITASTGGNRGFCQTYPVIDGKARLPQSLALAPDSSSNPADQVSVTVMAFSVSKDRIDQEGTFDDCTIPNVSLTDSATEDPSSPPPNARVLRRSKQPYIDSRNLYVPMALKYACYGVSCTGDQTCKGGVCTASDVDATLLPDYDPALLYGSSSACFDASLCLGDAVGVSVIDANQCIYEVPAGKSFRDIGMNVRVIYENFRAEVLDLDPVEGFTIPDSTKPNRFQLATGLCSGSGPKIMSVAASESCASKNAFQPLCTKDSTTTTLAPTPSAVYLLVDQDASMVDYVGATVDPSANLGVALSLALQDPVFMTTKVSLRRVPDPGQECTSSTYGNGTFAPYDPQKTLLPLASPTVATSGLALDALLPGAYGSTWGNSTTGYNKRVVILATNRTLDPNDTTNCGPAAAAGPLAAVKTASTQGIDTYVFSLRNAFESAAVVQARIDAATAFATASGATVFSAEGGASSDPNAAKLAAAQGLAQIVSNVSACVYDKPASFTDPTTGTLSVKPGPFAPVALTLDTTCSNAAAATTANGWGIDQDGKHIRVCGAACTSIRDAITLNELLTVQQNMSGPAESNQVLVQLDVP
jgi:hypothetical protein